MIKLDDIDLQIIKFILNNPEISHRTIAKKLNKSQPAISARIKKYNEWGLLRFQPGIDLYKANFFLVLVNLVVKNSEGLVEMAKYCPFVINAFRLSGKYNFCILQQP